ncbi:hypothetical protein HYPSUDRAFT_39427 [Hypholoma sublateritium FD-334 SS-4]|uniref:Uncharacterized protein n=1 Tax=Hypholoma sublateritium (strain FD-334 SS-4) TaxID=945553 RepID=A0A0D2P5F0_HYPSF|nr:hypothetical protein HYPSUDRAFT_39427 [Hypholoma sublateritium FD-334 SS-4]
MPYDLLLEIFRMNANMFADDGALDTARTTSQVCRSWRNIMLMTPSIWAKLIDLDCVQRLLLNKWRNELIRRSGSSLLWIKAKKLGQINPAHYLVNFLFDVLHQHWGRIQILVADVYGKDIHPIQYAPLSLPAPHLETFDLNIGAGGLDTSTLFSRQAPMLRRFTSQRNHVDITAPWLHQLHFIEFPWGNTTLPVLSVTQNLRELKIHRSKIRHATLPLPTVTLPNLRRLDICLDLRYVASILDNLEIPRNCSLNIYTWSTLTAYDDLWPVLDTVAQAAQHYFHSYPPTNILFQLSDERLTLEDSMHPDKFSLIIGFYRLFHIPNVPVCFVDKLQTMAKFSGVKELTFYAKDLPPLDFLSFINCFSSVQTIRTSEQNIQYLISIQAQESDDPRSVQGGCKNIFPNLSTVILTAEPDQRTCHIGKVTTNFILSRIQHGQPLSVLNLTQAVSVELTALDLLRDIAGLEVLMNTDGNVKFI